MQEEKVIVLAENAVLPEPKKMDVWIIERNGHPPVHCLSEETARKHIATHKKCECGELVEINSFCRKCASKRSRENYFKKEFKEWDFETPLVLHHDDEFFFSQDELDDYIADKELTEDEVASLMLVICEPNYCPQITEDFFADYIPENYDGLHDFDKGLIEKLKDLNQYISSLRPISWSGGKFRTSYSVK